mgnify:FL=1
MRRWLWCAILIGVVAKAGIALSPNDILPPNKIRPGMKGYGLSVFKGTTIERFPVTVLGVLERYDFDMDAILIRIDGGTVLQRRSGVIAGMSGSPIFINGKLVGAIAFGWGFPKEPLCGVTPITAMLACTDPKRYPSPRLTTGTLRPKGAPIVVGNRSIHRVWLAANQKEAEALRKRLRPDEGLLVPVATPLLVSGVPRSLLPLLQRMLEPYNFLVMEGAGGKAVSIPVKDAPIRPGSALGVQIVGGDVDLTAVGTVTWVEGNKVLAFGHPLFGFGSVDFPMTSAYVLDIFPSVAFSFKLAVGLKERGHLTQDRIFAVAGELGKPARTVPMEIALRNFAQKLQRFYDLKLASHREIINIAAYISLLGTIATGIGEAEEGSTYMRLRVEAKDLPPIVRENWFPNEGRMGIGGIILITLGGARISPIAELADIMEAAVGNRFGEVHFTRISAELEFYPQRRTAWIDRVTARKTRVKPAEKVPVTLTLKGWGGFERTMRVELEVPANARPGRLRFLVGGGMMGEMVRQQSGYRRPRPRSLRELWEQLRDVYANNEVLIATSPLTSGVEIAGKRWESLPSATLEALLSMGSSDIQSIRDYREKRFAFDRILTGMASITLTVETDEREKEAPPRLPIAQPSPPSPPPNSPPGSPPPEGGDGEEMALLMLQRLATLTQQWRDLTERAWLSIQLMRQKWQDENTLPRWWLSVAPLLQREEKMDKDQPPQPPDWEEVRRLSPEQPEGKEPPQQPQPPAQPAPPSARTQPLARLPKTWVLEKGDDWLKGKLDGTLVSTDGTVTLGYHPQRLYEPTETIGAFCLLPNGDGTLLVGTLGPARLIQLSPNGERKLIAEIADEAIITAIAKAPDGAVWFATAPNGKLFLVAPNAEKPEEVCQLNATVWAIAFLDDGTAVLATGPEGKVWTLVSGEKEPKVWVQLPERHALALAKGKDGSLFVGTNPRGKVYRLAPDGRVEPFFEAPQNPVQALAVDSKGNLYVGVSGAAIVYLVQPDGRWRELRRFTPERHIMALWGLEDGVLVATGSPGKLYRLTSDGVASWLYDSEQSHLLCVAVNGNEAFLIPSESGEVVRLVRNKEGTYQSPILDAGQLARWGVLRFVADVPEGAQVLLQARTGNTAYPDATWSDWSPALTISDQPLSCPPARYLQVRVILRANDEGKAPLLKRLAIVYLPKNQPPRLTVQEPSAGAVVSGKVTLRWRGEDPDRDQLSYEAFYSSDGGKTWTQIREGGSAQSAQRQQQEKPSEETKSDGQKEAKPEERPQPSGATTASSLTWDTTKVSDGVYWLKIVASDRIANPDDPQTAEQIIAPVIVDNTPPIIGTHSVKRDGNKLLVPVYDNTSIASAEYRAEGSEWIAAVCQDGVFDQPYEILIVDLSRLPKEAKAVEIRARDAAGNEQVAKLPIPQ